MEQRFRIAMVLWLAFGICVTALQLVHRLPFRQHQMGSGSHTNGGCLENSAIASRPHEYPVRKSALPVHRPIRKEKSFDVGKTMVFIFTGHPSNKTKQTCSPHIVIVHHIVGEQYTLHYSDRFPNHLITEGVIAFVLFLRFRVPTDIWLFGY